MENNYYKRFTDAALQDRLRLSGAVLIQGPKGCGKTETSPHEKRASGGWIYDSYIDKISEIWRA